MSGAATGKPITVVVVDDEPLAREGLSSLLSRDPDIEVLAVCASGQSAVRMIVDLAPDIVFLDVQMPGLDGFDVIRAVGVDRMPFIVFTTAFDRYALDAFQAHALEYLLKPFSDERFLDALTRAKQFVVDRRLAKVGEKVAGLLEEVGSASPGKRHADRLIVRGTGKTYFVEVDDIEWIEAADYYASVRARGKNHLVRESLASLADRLDPSRFLRVHRSWIVNTTRVAELRSSATGDSYAVMHDGTRVRLARGSKARLTALLGSRG